MEIYFLSALLVLTGLCLFFLIRIYNKETGGSSSDLLAAISSLQQYLKDSERQLRDEFAINRKEHAASLKELREEVGKHLHLFTQTFSDQFHTLTRSTEEKLEVIRRSIEEKLLALQQQAESREKEGRRELKETLEGFKTELQHALKDYKENLRDLFSDFSKQQQTQALAHAEKTEAMKRNLESAIRNLQEGNEKKLEEMRVTVDEKLQKTLEARLSASFELVSKNLESVQKGLGEMQHLATGVGDLKKVLSNVKTRGMLGEIQLANILEQLLSPEQYDVNVCTRPDSSNRVEFAIKIPQQDPDHKILLMPIDSKFPLEDYYSLTTAFEHHDQAAADQAGKALEAAIRKAAKDIHEKYICPPYTTEIGLLFLPVEGLYAEAVRRPALMEFLQREYQIILTGPTTLSAILHTISFGYRTMAMEQRSGEIRRTLSAVKTEFEKFGDVLKSAQAKLNKVSDEIDVLVGTRTKKIQAKLKSFTELPEAESAQILGPESEEDPS